MCRYYLFWCWYWLLSNLGQRSLWWFCNRVYDIYVNRRLSILHWRDGGKQPHSWNYMEKMSIEDFLFSHFNLMIFPPLKQIFYRERLNGYYRVAVCILSNFLSSFPFLVAIAVSTGTITYYMVKFRPEFSHYVYYCLNIYACISVIESLMMVVASLVPNFLMRIITGARIIVRTYT